MNILYIDPNVKENNTYPLYTGTYNELKSKASCFIYRKNFSDISGVLTLCRKPDVIIFGLGWFKFKNFSKISGLDNLKCPKICFIFKPQNNWKEKLNFCRINNFNLLLTPLPHFKEYQKITGIKTRRFCYGADPLVFRDRGLKKSFDFGFSGALHNAEHYCKGAFTSNNLRLRIQKLLKGKKYSCFLNGSDSIKPRINSQEEYAKKISQSKIWLSTTSPFQDMPARYFEIGMSKTLIFTDKIPLQYQDILKDGQTCVEFSSDLSNFIEKLDFYLNNWHISEEIINRAYTLFISKFTWKHRADSLLKLIKGL